MAAVEDNDEKQYDEYLEQKEMYKFLICEVKAANEANQSQVLGETEIERIFHDF